MLDMTSLFGNQLPIAVPPSDPHDYVYKWLNILQTYDKKLYHNVISETDPRYKLCFPLGLSISENQVEELEFIKSHVLIPETKTDYKFANDPSSQVELQGLRVKYKREGDTAQNIIEIMEERTLYTKFYNTVDVLFIEASFTSRNTKEGGLPSLQPQTKRTIPLREYRVYSFQTAREILEQKMIELSSSPQEGQNNFTDFEFQLTECISKFSTDLTKFFLVESLRFQKNNLPPTSSLQCIDWASKKFQQLQCDSLLAFIAFGDRGDDPVSEFSYLFQPLEDYILTQVYPTVMKVLIQQTNAQELLFQSKIKEMQAHPLTHQPEEILPEFRRLALRDAAAELKALTSDRGKTPMQKLFCLKKAFIALESSLLSLIPPTKTAPGPPTSIPIPKGALRDSRRKRTITEKEHSVPEYRRLAFEQWKQRKSHVMQLVLLLLIYHAPENFLAHLEFIQFHTINDEKFASLSLYYVIFRSSANQLLETVPRKKIVAKPQSGALGIEFTSFIWGLVNDEVETYPVMCESLIGKQVVSVRCGDKHMIALTKEGIVYTCGDGSEGQLGHGRDYDSWSFTEVTLLSSLSIVAIAAGGGHCAAVSKSGKLFCWGGNLWGQIGIGFNCDNIQIPKQVEFSGQGRHKVIKVACGAAHNLALLSNGSVWSWGMGANGRLGHGNEYSLSSPKKIEALRFQMSDIACGWGHSICISGESEVYTFGNGSDGQLGHGTHCDEFEPKKINFNFGGIFSCSAFNHTMVASTKGLFTWGWGEHGVLGLGDLKSKSTPHLVEGFLVNSVACGAFHSAATTNDGILLTWGFCAKGQLGHGDTTAQSTPMVVSFLHNEHIIEVSCGFSTTVAVQAANQVEDIKYCKQGKKNAAGSSF